jgi:hypothetical protein
METNGFARLLDETWLETEADAAAVTRAVAQEFGRRHSIETFNPVDALVVATACTFRVAHERMSADTGRAVRAAVMELADRVKNRAFEKGLCGVHSEGEQLILSSAPLPVSSGIASRAQNLMMLLLDKCGGDRLVFLGICRIMSAGCISSDAERETTARYGGAVNIALGILSDIIC